MECHRRLTARCAGAAPAVFTLAVAVAVSLPDLTLSGPVTPRATHPATNLRVVTDKYQESSEAQVYAMRRIPGENKGSFELLEVERLGWRETTSADSIEKICGEESREIAVRLPWGGEVTHVERRCVKRGAVILDFRTLGLTCEDNVVRHTLARYAGPESRTYADVQVYGSVGCVVKRGRTPDSHCCKFHAGNASLLCLRKEEYDDQKSEGLVRWACE